MRVHIHACTPHMMHMAHMVLKGHWGHMGVYGHAPHTYHIYFYRGLVTSWTSNALGAQQHLKGLRRHRGINTPFDHLPTDHQPSPQGGWSRPLMAPDPSQPLRPPETTSWGSGVLGSSDFINYLLPRARARYVSCTPFWTIWTPDLDHGLQAK